MDESLYQRLGGAKGIRAIAQDVIALHVKNPTIGARFQNVDLEKLHRLASEFFAMGSGGPEAYTGRDMLATHRGMNISEQEFLAVVDDMMAALEKNGVGPQTRTEVLGILFSLKGQIIRV